MLLVGVLRLAAKRTTYKYKYGRIILVQRTWSSTLRPFSSTPFMGIKTLISATTAKAIAESRPVKFVDVRAPEVYAKGHIPAAANVHAIFTYLATSDAEGVKKLTSTFEGLFQDAGINSDHHVITYEQCLDTLFGASCRGLYLFKLLGHSNVSILHGGLEGWTKEGYPLSTQAPEVTRGTFQASWTPSGLWSDQDSVMKVITEEKDTVLLDVRDPEEWKGVSSSPYGVDFAPRKGRLPAAVSIPWRNLMKKTDDGLTHFKDPDEIKGLCAAKGITPDKKIIIYCFKGARSANTFVALKEAGFGDVTNYFASWDEWSRDHSLPIDANKY